MQKTLSEKSMALIEDRGIPEELAVRFGLYTGRFDADTGEVVPDARDGRVIVFPYTEHGQVVAEHYRAHPKKFWQRKGGKKTFWNADALDDPALENGTMPLVITEGEYDQLAVVASGFPLAVSVPDGAPAVPDGELPGTLAPIDQAAEQTGKFEYLWNNRERLKRVKRFVIATDSDPPGQRLAAELVRRLLPARCSFVTWPEGCKDANDVLVRHGEAGLCRVINGAQPYPVKGLYRLGDYPDVPKFQVYSTGWSTVDTLMKLYFGELLIISGTPNHGKTIWTLNLLVNLAVLHGWRSALFSAEMPTVPHLRDRLRRIIGTPHEQADRFIQEMFLFLDADPTGEQDDDIDLQWIIDRASDAVMRDGIRVLVIDPWNQVEHARGKGESMVDYIGRSLRSLSRFGKTYQVVVIVVAHPTKDIARDGKMRTPTPYDIEGAAHWFNRADHAVIIERPDPMKDEAAVIVAKCRFDEAGERGKVMMAYDRQSSRFNQLDQQKPLFSSVG